MQAVNNYIIVEKIKTEQKKVAGLIVTEDTDQDNRYTKAKVISVGNLVEGIKKVNNRFTTETFSMHFQSKTIQKIKKEYVI